MKPIYCAICFFLALIFTCEGAVAPKAPRALNLQRDRLSLGYRRRLQVAVHMLESWANSNGFNLRGSIKSVKLINELLVSYCQFCYDSGKAYWVALYAVLGIQTIARALKGQLRAAFDSLQTWKLSMPIHSRLPLRHEIVVALSHYSIMAALSLDTGRAEVWLLFAGVLRLFFFGLLRPKEFLSLDRKDVRLPSAGAFRNLSSGVVIVRDPKNRAHSGRLQARLLRDPACVAWLSWVLALLPDSSRIWPYSCEVFIQLFQRALSFFELGATGFSLGSFRAGGATALLESGMAISQIKFCGGWSADKTLCSYLQEAESALTLIQLSASAAHRLEKALTALSHLELPPPVAPATLLQQWIRPRPWQS